MSPLEDDFVEWVACSDLVIGRYATEDTVGSELLHIPRGTRVDLVLALLADMTSDEKDRLHRTLNPAREFTHLQQRAELLRRLNTRNPR